MARESGFVIERYTNSALEYWGGRSATDFQPAPAEAIRFARAIDGAVVLSWILDGNGRVAEHVWLEKEPADGDTER